MLRKSFLHNEIGKTPDWEGYHVNLDNEMFFR